MGTASRYGRIAGSRLAEGGRAVPRFFHFDGVWLGWMAKREYGNGLLEGAEMGWGAGRGRESRSCLSSRTSLGDTREHDEVRRRRRVPIRQGLASLAMTSLLPLPRPNREDVETQWLAAGHDSNRTTARVQHWYGRRELLTRTIALA